VTLMTCKVETLDAKLSAGNLHFKGDILVHGDVKLSAGNLELKLARTQASYCVNGVGEAGMTTILYDLSAGNAKVYYEQ
ncbi:MAG: FapA family protein, partial [Anaeroplasmataceae bacterium]|nr:FapA family protein [Anaeroplasmataceae bacterium]